MLQDLENLIQLQVADKEILRLKEEVAALPKRVAVIEAKLAATKAKLEKAKTAAKADEATRKKHETAIQDAQTKISKYKDQSLAVKTNDQYKALMQETDLKRLTKVHGKVIERKGSETEGQCKKTGKTASGR